MWLLHCDRPYWSLFGSTFYLWYWNCLDRKQRLDRCHPIQKKRACWKESMVRSEWRAFLLLISVFGFDDDRVIGRVWDFCYCCCCCGCDRVYIELIKKRRKKCRDRRVDMLFAAISSWVKIRDQIKKRKTETQSVKTAVRCLKWTELCVCLRGIIVIFCMPTSLFLSLSLCRSRAHSLRFILNPFSACVCASSVWSGAIWVIVCIAYADRKMWMTERQ